MTTNLELHEAIDSPELRDELAAFAATERRAVADREGLQAAEVAFEWADAGSDPAERQRAAQTVAGARVLAESSHSPQLSPAGRRLVRGALEAAGQWYSERVDYEPVSDPRDRPRPLKPKTRDLGEQVARAQTARAAFRTSFDEWWRDSSKFSHDQTVALLVVASHLCDLADEVRTLASQCLTAVTTSGR